MIYVLKNEPSPAAFEDILDYGLQHCRFALMVIQPLKRMTPQVEAILKRLEPDLVEKKVLNKWPGTQLTAGQGFVHKYKLEQPFVEKIKKINGHLYGWLQPNYPEDLCLLTENDEPWFVSIAHAKDSYFSLSEEEKNTLIQSIPELGRILTKDKGNRINQ